MIFVLAKKAVKWVYVKNHQPCMSQAFNGGIMSDTHPEM